MGTRYLLVEAQDGMMPAVISIWRTEAEGRAEIERLSAIYAADGCECEGNHTFTEITRPDGTRLMHNLQAIVID